MFHSFKNLKLIIKSKKKPPLEAEVKPFKKASASPELASPPRF